MNYKRLIILLSFSLLFISFYVGGSYSRFDSKSNSQTSNNDDCPLQGNAKSLKVQNLNVFKNRSVFPEEKDFNHQITLISILTKGDDTERWSNESAAKITGYVRDVKSGGIETANCKSEDKNERDTHIELVLNPNSYEKNEAFVVEITPRLRKIMDQKGENWTTSMIRSKYLGRWVEVEGWMLFDVEHSNMAENTRPGNPKNWRATAWEIHPITKIKIADGH